MVGVQSKEMKVDRAIYKGMHEKHIHTVRLAVRHPAHGVQSSAAGAAADTVRVGTVLCGQARGGQDQEEIS